ncbi:MAG: metallophosphoesterase [Acidobacteriota bacterium]|nr:metallophosphoesterase [Acidobacteriota bacterium]
MSTATIVISDLHIGAGPLDDCDAELERCLLDFLADIGSAGSPVELVINGDFLDFAQAPPWKGKDLEAVTPLGIPLCFTQEQSLAKLEAICNDHSSVFAALAHFLAVKVDNRLVINPGNHDADFFWPQVREQFINKICSENPKLKAQIFLNLEQVYHPNSLPSVWIEHGNQYDPTNCFFVDEYDATIGTHAGKRLYWDAHNPPILKDQTGQERLYECLGTRFLIKYLNKLDSNYPFVDNVKPFSRFLRIFGVSALRGGYGPIKASVAIWGILRYLLGSLITDPQGFLNAERREGNPTASLLLGALQKLSSDQRKSFTTKLREAGFCADRPLTMYLQDVELSNSLLEFLSEDIDLLDGFPVFEKSYLDSSSISASSGYLTLVNAYDVDETKALKGVAKNLIGREGLTTVIMGHTHEPVCDLPHARYINTGSWTRYYRIGDNKIRSWDILRTDSHELFPYQLNYAEIPPGHETARMETYASKS